MSDSAGKGHIDLEAFWENYSDMKEALPSLAKLFTDQAGPSMARIQATMMARDAEGLRASSHRFKGALAQLYAKGLAGVAFSLEKAGHANSFEGTDALFAELSRGVDELLEELKHLDYRV
jgi:HPt (histidine-containing phosphotransfer) domain-containing protein